MCCLAAEAQGLKLADCHDVVLDYFVDIWSLLAWKVAAVLEERIGVEARCGIACAVGYRGLDLDVCFCDGEKGQDQGQEGFVGQHGCC